MEENPMDIMRRHSLAQARHQAHLIDEEILMWMRMGFSLDELRLIHWTGPMAKPSQVWPAIMVDESAR